MLPEVLPLRHASRELVRELGFLQTRALGSELSHSHIHALIEIEGRGSIQQSELAAALRLDKSTTSRIASELESRQWIRMKPSEDDARVRLLALTARGRAKLGAVHRDANARVEAALSLLAPEERADVVRGMQLYARALERARRRAAYIVRPIAGRDRADVARLIRTVMPEFGASGPGYAIMDPEVDDMFAAYRGKRSAYWVVVGANDHVVGGGGFAPLGGGDETTCELRKMYFLPELRGLGYGQAVLDLCIEGARQAGFSRMYLETLTGMARARALYEKNGFSRLPGPLGNTGHFGCNTFYARDLPAPAPAPKPPRRPHRRLDLRSSQ
jgi:putative acetyltransferase